MRHIIPGEDLRDGHQHDLEIKPGRLSSQILSIEGDFIGDGELISTIDLSPTGEARDETLHAFFCAELNQIILVEQRRAWPYEAHITPQDGPDLG